MLVPERERFGDVDAKGPGQCFRRFDEGPQRRDLGSVDPHAALRDALVEDLACYDPVIHRSFACHARKEEDAAGDRRFLKHPRLPLLRKMQGACHKTRALQGVA
jgi:hypothetical protein